MINLTVYCLPYSYLRVLSMVPNFSPTPPHFVRLTQKESLRRIGRKLRLTESFAYSDSPVDFNIIKFFRKLLVRRFLTEINLWIGFIPLSIQNLGMLAYKIPLLA